MMSGIEPADCRTGLGRGWPDRMDLHGKKVVVVGLARSGVSAAALLSRHGAHVTVTDRKRREELSSMIARLPEGIFISLGGHDDDLIRGADLVVVSPGVPLTVIEGWRRMGAVVTGELELGYRFAPAPIMAITGTNGKSTVTTLAGEMMEAAGCRVYVGGNIGNALTEGILEVEDGRRPRPDWIVAEVSSFQLETIESFRPRLAAILNLTPDHIDRHGSIPGYRAAKARVFERQEHSDGLVLNADDPFVRSYAAEAHSRVAWFSRQRTVHRGVFLDGDRVIYRIDGREGILIPADQIGIKGVHNLENAMAAAALALLAGGPAEEIAGVLRRFKGLSHRLELVDTIRGVAYINDSKGTNIGAVEKSLASFSDPLILIAGGRDKGKTDFSPLTVEVRRSVKAMVLIGEAADRLEETFKGVTRVIRAGGMEEAVRIASEAAQPGDVVLLSPGCASFDMFRDFEDRGERFREAVKKLRD